jgi:5'-3' exoribonuclease 1
MEPDVLNRRMNKGTSGYEDSKLIKYSKFVEAKTEENNDEPGKESVDGTLKGGYEVDFKKYRLAYYRKAHTKVDEVKNVCLDYIKGLCWVLNYYVEDLPSWNWSYQHHYAPFLSDLSWWIYSFTEPQWGRSQPILPFQQLLCVLPTKSKNLVPEPLDKLFEEDSKLSEFYPTEFKVDLEGKKNDWEGVVILPFVDLEKVGTAYDEIKRGISDKDMKRNIVGKTYLYGLGKEYTYKSIYGDIENCMVYTNPIQI